MRHIERQPLASFGKNGTFIDFDESCSYTGAPYERFAFAALAEKSRADFGIGPNIVNQILGTDVYRAFTKPDAMLFMVQKQMLKLATLAEFKSGKRLHLHHKVNGFQGLTAAMRQDEDFLLEKLSRLFTHLPKNVSVYIPDDDQIEVVTVNPYMHDLPQDPVDNHTEFMVSYCRLPYDEGY